MKLIPVLVLLFGLSSKANAGPPFCSIAEIVDGRPSMESNTLEFKKSQKLEISMKDGSAKQLRNGIQC